MIRVAMYDEIIKRAIKAKQNAYAPYSRFAVGAALQTEGGGFFCGCNAENASYSAAMCAERAAVFSAVSSGERAFKQIAVVSSGRDFCYPCGVCLQVLAEFCDFKTFKIIAAKTESEFLVYTLCELLPRGFKLS